MDVRRARHPDRDAFVAPRVDVARIADRHLGIGRVEAADVLVREAVLRADEDFPQRPFTGHWTVSLSSTVRGGGGMRRHRALSRVRLGRLAYPGPLFPGLDPRAHPVAIARAVTHQYFVKLVPVDFAEVVMPARLVPRELVVGDHQAEIFGLRHRLVDETLAQLVVRQKL